MFAFFQVTYLYLVKKIKPPKFDNAKLGRLGEKRTIPRPLLL